jgi:hypothetical protein
MQKLNKFHQTCIFIFIILLSSTQAFADSDDSKTILWVGDASVGYKSLELNLRVAIDFSSSANFITLNISLTAAFKNSYLSINYDDSLSDYEETTTNPDGTKITKDLSGVHTDDTFQRAFPDWRVTTRVDWVRNRWSGVMSFRWTDEMTLDDGVTDLDSEMFADMQVSYNPSIADESMVFSIGFNNVFDEDPPVCFPCGVIGLSNVSHDLPGRVGYLKFSYEVAQ